MSTLSFFSMRVKQMYGVLEFIIWLTVWMLVVAIGEYSSHRWFMHRNRSYLPKWIFDNHTIEHHYHKRNDINIDLSVGIHLVVGSPLIIGCYFWGLSCLLALLCAFLFHALVWTKIHRAIHGIENNWTQKLKWFTKFKAHHELHHKRPGKNFGVVFLFTDYIFGTKVRS